MVSPLPMVTPTSYIPFQLHSSSNHPFHLSTHCKKRRSSRWLLTRVLSQEKCVKFNHLHSPQIFHASRGRNELATIQRLNEASTRDVWISEKFLPWGKSKRIVERKNLKISHRRLLQPYSHTSPIIIYLGDGKRGLKDSSRSFLSYGRNDSTSMKHRKLVILQISLSKHRVHVPTMKGTSSK